MNDQLSANEETLLGLMAESKRLRDLAIQTRRKLLELDKQISALRTKIIHDKPTPTEMDTVDLNPDETD